MPRNEVIEFKVTAEEKEQIRSEAKRRGMTTGGFARAAALHELSEKEEAQVSREEPYEVKVVAGTARPDKDDWVRQRAKDYESLPIVDLPPETPKQDREGWIGSTARTLMMEKGLSKHAARIQATEEWEADND